MMLLNWRLVAVRATTRLFAVLVATLGLALPALSDSEQNIRSTVRSVGSAATQQLGAALSARLKAAISADGLIEGVEACHQDAQPLTQATSDALGITVSRTALRLRNSANAPTVWQREQLQRFQSEMASGVPASEIFAIRQEGVDTGVSAWVYMSPIVTGGVCLNCHGDNLQPDVLTALASRYPDDQATGFALGDLRGAFVATIPAEVVSANIQAN